MRQLGWTGYCPNDGTELAIRLTPRDAVLEGLMPNPDRLIESFDVEARCPECEEWVEPDGLRATP